LAIAGLVALGAAQYLLLLVRARNVDTPYVWYPTTTLENLWFHVSGSIFRNRMFMFTPEEFWGERVPMFIDYLVQQFRWTFPLAVLGCFLGASARATAALALVFAGCATFALNYRIADIHVYFIPAFAVTALWLALGTEWILKRSRGRLWVTATLTIILIGQGTFSAVKGRPETPRGDTTSTVRVLDRVPPRSVVISDGWETSTTLWYMTLGEHVHGGQTRVLTNHQADDLADYLQGRGPLWIEASRELLAEVLPVYAIRDMRIGEYQAEGLSAYDLGEDLYLLTPAPELDPELAGWHGLDSSTQPMRPQIEWLNGWRLPEPWGRWAIGPRASVRLPSLPGPATVVLRLAPWDKMGSFRTVHVSLGTEEIGKIHLEGPAWKMQEFEFQIGNFPAAATMALEIRDEHGNLARDGRLSLPVGDIFMRE
jgi:hypothetical protein